MEKLEEIITGNQVKTLDLAVYSFGSSKTNPVIKALIKAKGKNPDLQIRIVTDKGNASAKPEIVELLESLQADVRVVNKINHHKYIIANGIHCDMKIGKECIEDPMSVKILQGSGNFNAKADNLQDESFTYIEEEDTISKQYSQNFATLWNHATDLGQTILPEKLAAEKALKITSSELSKNLRAYFTESNFTIADNSTSFRYNDQRTISDLIVSHIKKARKSVKIAHTHFGIKDIALALKAKLKDPNFEVQIFVDNQNFMSKYGVKKEEKELAACEGKSGCGETGIQWWAPLLFPNGVEQAQANNIDVRFKYYMYKWDAREAAQMHSKYVIIDDEIAISGSFNLSLNSETNSFEDVVLLDSKNSIDQKIAVDQFVKNFKEKWNRNRDEVKTVYKLIKEGRTSWLNLPLSIDWQEVEKLRAYYRSNQRTSN